MPREMILFNEEYYKTKTALQKHISNIVNSIPIGEVIDEKHRYFSVFMELLDRHPSQLEVHNKGLHYFVFLVGSQFQEKQLNAVCVDKTAFVLTYNYNKLIAKLTSKVKQIVEVDLEPDLW